MLGSIQVRKEWCLKRSEWGNYWTEGEVGARSIYRIA
jgi:hypothetical protein